MKPPYPSITAEWHNDTYPAIDPSRPELSVAGKTVVITGAGGGIGSETAYAFARAGAGAIALLGRTTKTLEETKKRVEADHRNVKVTIHATDISNPADAKKAASEIGPWDVLLLNAGYLAERVTVEKSDVDDWWKGYEINVKGTMVMSQAFLPSRKANAAILGTSSAVVSMPGTMMVTTSSYASSKLAVIKFMEILAAEVPDVFVATLHPGTVQTSMYEKANMKGLPMDEVQLPAHFAVWLVSPEAAFLRGKFVWVHWDVDELKAKADEIKDGAILTSNIVGWPFAP